MSIRIGIIAEDQSDVDVIREIAEKIITKRDFTIRRYIGHGCGRIHGKCHQWADSLRAQRCSSLIVLHDLDEAQLPVLHNSLVSALTPSPIAKHLIVIPVREIEAWLLSDHQAIKKAMHIKQPINKFPNPEAIQKPKERLEDTIYLRSGRTIRYVNAVHNSRIASEAKVSNLRRCHSFVPLERFLNGICDLGA